MMEFLRPELLGFQDQAALTQAGVTDDIHDAAAIMI
jgi:hypothetical protein